MILRRLKEIGQFFLEGRNWANILLVSLFFLLTLLLFYFNILHYSQADYLSGKIIPGSKFLTAWIILVFLWFVSPLWLDGLVWDILNRRLRAIKYILIILAFAFVLPNLGPALKLFDFGWLKLDLIIPESWFFQVFIVAIALSLVIFYLLIEPMSKIEILKRISWHKMVPWLLFILGFATYLLYTFFKFNNFSYPLKDVGIFNQAVWHLAHFELPASSIRNINNLWGDHFHPILILLVPFYWIKNDPRTLLFLQSFVVSLGVFPIYHIAYQKFKNVFLSFAFGFSWVFFIGIQQAISFGFYPETLAITFLAFALYFLWQEKKAGYWIFIALALMCKENIALYISALGIYLFFFEKRRILGFITVAISLAWFEFAMWLIPTIAGSKYIYFRYELFGKSPIEVIKTIILNPFYTFSIFISPAVKVKTLLYFFTSVGFLAFISPFFIVLLPNLMEKFLSSDPKIWEIGYHYGAGISTFLFVAAILGLVNLLKNNPVRQIKATTEAKVAFCGMCLILLVFLITAQNHANPLLKLAKKSFWKFRQDPEMTIAFSKIPKDASLEVQDSLAIQLSNRKDIYLWEGKDKSDYILLSPLISTYPLSQKEYQEEVNKLLKNPGYGIKFINSKVVVFERGLKSQEEIPADFQKSLNSLQ